MFFFFQLYYYTKEAPNAFIRQQKDFRFHVLALDLFENSKMTFTKKEKVPFFYSTSSMKKLRGSIFIATRTITKINYILKEIHNFSTMIRIQKHFTTLIAHIEVSVPCSWFLELALIIHTLFYGKFSYEIHKNRTN